MFNVRTKAAQLVCARTISETDSDFGEGDKVLTASSVLSSHGGFPVHPAPIGTEARNPQSSAADQLSR